MFSMHDTIQCSVLYQLYTHEGGRNKKEIVACILRYVSKQK